MQLHLAVWGNEHSSYQLGHFSSHFRLPSRPNLPTARHCSLSPLNRNNSDSADSIPADVAYCVLPPQNAGGLHIIKQNIVSTLGHRSFNGLTPRSHSKGSPNSSFLFCLLHRAPSRLLVRITVEHQWVRRGGVVRVSSQLQLLVVPAVSPLAPVKHAGKGLTEASVKRVHLFGRW